MQVLISDLKDKMSLVCRHLKVPETEIEAVVMHFLDGELRGKPTHGVAKFCFESQFFSQREHPPEIVRDFGPIAVIDAHKEIGPISAGFAVDVAIEKARHYGIGLVGMNNSQRYGILATWTERIAAHNFVGIVLNTSHADAAVYGAQSPMLGVNPLSYAIPSEGLPLTLDMSTTKMPMGHLWECRRNNDLLAPLSFLSAEGTHTQDPFAAVSAEIFGGHKGFALSILIQVLTGSLFGFPMGKAIQTQFDTGYCFIAIDPVRASGGDSFLRENRALADQLRATATSSDVPQIRLPGDASMHLKEKRLESGYIDLRQSTYEQLVALSQQAGHA